jgi:hypothetical protein
MSRTRFLFPIAAHPIQTSKIVLPVKNTEYEFEYDWGTIVRLERSKAEHPH